MVRMPMPAQPSFDGRLDVPASSNASLLPAEFLSAPIQGNLDPYRSLSSSSRLSELEPQHIDALLNLLPPRLGKTKELGRLPEQECIGFAFFKSKKCLDDVEKDAKKRRDEEKKRGQRPTDMTLEEARKLSKGLADIQKDLQECLAKHGHLKKSVQKFIVDELKDAANKIVNGGETATSSQKHLDAFDKNTTKAVQDEIKQCQREISAAHEAASKEINQFNRELVEVQKFMKAAAEESKMIFKGLTNAYMQTVALADGATSVKPSTTKALEQLTKKVSKENVNACVDALASQREDVRRKFKGQDGPVDFYEAIDAFIKEIKRLA